MSRKDDSMYTRQSPVMLPPARICAHAHRRPGSRGVAVILALVAVGAAVVLSLALASTRDQGALTSDSLVRVAAARAASAGSLDLACALVEQHGLSGFDTVTVPNATLFPAVTIGSRQYWADIVDLATTDPIDSDTIAVRILARAQSDGVTQTSTAIGRLIQPDTVVRADVDLSEFGLLTTSDAPGSLRFSDSSTVGVWAAAPLAQLREPVMIGSSKLNEDALVIGGSARLRGYTVLTQGDFPETDEELNDAIANKVYPLPHEVHVPEAPRPGRSAFAYDYNLATGTMNELTNLLNPPANPDPEVPTGFTAADGNMNLLGDLVLTEAPMTLRVSNHADPTRATWRQLDISGDLRLGSGNAILIEAPTLLIVRGDLRMDEGLISVAQTAPFTLVVFGDVEITNSRVVLQPFSDKSSDPLVEYHGVSNIMIYATMDGRTSLSGNSPSNRTFHVENSTIMAQIYAPSRTVRFGESRLFGRALAMEMEFKKDSSFYYDPALNEGRGWSNPTSGLWEDAATPRAEVMRIAELTDASVSLGTADDGSDAALDPSGTVVAIDPPAGRIVVPAHAAFVGGTPRNYDDIIQSILESVTPPDDVRGEGPPNTIMLGAIVRDFHEERSPSGHPDFERILRNRKSFQSIACLALDTDGKPIYSGNPQVKTRSYKSGGDEIPWTIARSSDTVETVPDESNSNPPLKNWQSFSSWFNDQPGLNISMPVAVQFRIRDGSREFRIDETSNPAKGMLYGDLPPLDPSAGHALENGHFTMEFALGFKRDTSTSGGQSFTIRTNGDALVFIDGRLVLEVVSKRGNHMQKQKVPMDRLPIANNAYGDIRIFFANRTKDAPVLQFRGNFPMWQNIEWLKSAKFTEPAEATRSIERVARRAAEAKSTGILADEETIFADRSGNWSRRVEPVDASPAGPALPPPS
jgi:fibro-slime domain-containing protein